MKNAKDKNSPKISINIFADKLLKKGYLISKSEEEEYAKAHNMQFVRLKNGARILTAQKTVSDERYAYLNFHFLTGGYFDPKGKEGAHHFLEHLFFSGKLSRFLSKHYINHNAYTSQMRVVVYNNGIYTDQHPKVGILQGLPRTIDGLIDPPGLKNPDNFAYEKHVVLREISEHLGDHKALTFEKLYQTILDPLNPYANSPLGTADSVNSTTQQDIYGILNKYIGTANLIVASQVNGQKKESESFLNVLQEYIEKFPRKAVKTHIDLSLYSKTKPLSRDVIRHKLSINNNLVSLFLVWKFKMEAFSQDVTAFNFLIQHLRNVFFNEAREIGLGYTIDLFNFHMMPDLMLLGAFVVVPSNEEKESLDKLLNLMKKVVLDETRNIEELNELLKIEKATQKVNPISVRSRLEASVNTLADFNLLANSEFARQVYLRVTVADLQKMLELIQNSISAAIVIGDVL